MIGFLRRGQRLVLRRHGELDDRAPARSRAARARSSAATVLGSASVPHRRAVEPEARRRCRDGQGPQRRPAGKHAGEERRVLDVARHRADRVEAVAQHLDPGAGDHAEARLVADDAAIRRRAGSPSRRSGVPKASGTMPSATAAAEPLDEPPGVCAGLCGLAVLPGVKQANSVVTVLPRTIAPARPRQRDAGGVGRRAMPLIDRRAVAGRHVGGVDQVLDRDRDAVQRAARRPPRRAAAPRRAPPRGSRYCQAPTTGSRAAMRSRQAATRASAVSWPAAICRAASRAERESGSGMALGLAARICAAP